MAKAEDEIKQAVILLRKNGFEPQSINTIIARAMVKISIELMITDVDTEEATRRKLIFEHSWMEKI